MDIELAITQETTFAAVVLPALQEVQTDLTPEITVSPVVGDAVQQIVLTIQVDPAFA